ncbi:MAG: hypothetical protein ACJ73S_14430 [Mycobacteriales bacterium]
MLAESAVALAETLNEHPDHDVREILTSLRETLSSLGRVVGTLSAPVADSNPAAAERLQSADNLIAQASWALDEATLPLEPDPT